MKNIRGLKYGLVDGKILFDIPGIARYSVEDDSTIQVEPSCAAKEQYLGAIIIGLILPLLLKRRNVVTLHGSAVVSPSGGIAFIGERGSGKSTTAAALTTYGYAMLCDDVIPIAEGPRILPGIPRPKLLSDAYEALIGDPREAGQFFDGIDKYQVELTSSQFSTPLRAIFILGTTIDQELHIIPLKGTAKIQAVLRHTISLEGIDDPFLCFSRCAKRLSNVRVFRVSRPASRYCVDELVGEIMRLVGVGAEA
ncbi:MAG: hypothetical protein NT061_02595 [Spirochaetes bacterium]|nr:hypothetical protein [Spirochaetota bacterium]